MGIKKELAKSLGDAVVSVEKRVKRKLTEAEKAHQVAQRNAALPVEQGGLGLPPDNTAMDRAKAMGFDVDNPLYHGTSYTDIQQFLPEGGGERSKEVLDWYRKRVKKNQPVGFMNFRSGSFFSPKPEYAGNYAPEGKGVMYPVLARQENPLVLDHVRGRKVVANEPNPEKTIDAINLTDSSGGIDEVAIIEPRNIRSRFAAFDPMKRNSPNLLASAGAGIGAGVLYTPEDNQAQASMIGQAAKTFNKEALKYAEQLEKQGAPMEAIRRMTGYQFGTPIHRGVDGKWRQEISDENLELIDGYLSDNDQNIVFSGMLGGKEVQLNPYMAKQLGKTSAYSDGVVKTSDVLTAYPEFSDIQVKIKKPVDYAGETDFARGWYSPKGSGEIVGNTSNPRSLLSHELQHAIQEKEGFAKGGSVDSFDTEIGNLQRSIYNLKNFDEEVKQAQEWIDTSLSKILDMDVSQDEKGNLIREMHSRVEKNFPQYGYLRSLENKLNGITRYGSLDRTEAAMTQYRKLAGEEEARQTQKRLGLTMKERIDRDPRLDFDTPPEQQIVIGAQKGNADPRLLAGLGLGTGAAIAANNAMQSPTTNDIVRAAQTNPAIGQVRQLDTIAAPQGVIRKGAGLAAEYLGSVNKAFEGSPAELVTPTSLEEWLRKYSYGQADMGDAAWAAFDIPMVVAPAKAIGLSDLLKKQ